MGRKGGEFRRHSKPLEIIEEAVHLLRRSPLRVFTAYYLGTIPFVLGILYFWADMSRGYNASTRLIPAALGLVITYIFMKTMQTVFAQRLKQVISGEGPEKAGFQYTARTAVFHSIYQPWGFVLLPAALLITFPFGWCFAFYQNMTVLGPSDGNLSLSRKKAWEQALMWPAQNHMALGILLLFSFIVMANLLVTAIYVPQLIRIFLGIETIFSRSGPHIANTTYLMIIAAGTYLCVDPIVKAYYTLRCYYGQSLENGEDLLTELRSTRARRAAGLLTGILFMFISVAGLTAAGQTNVWAAGPDTALTGKHSPEEIEEAARSVLARLEYSWRLPRDVQEEEPEKGGFFYDLFQTIGNWLEKAGDAVERFFQWLEDLFKKLFPGSGGEKEEETSGGALGSAVLYILLFAGAAAAALILQRMFRYRSPDDDTRAQGPSLTKADLEDENILASDLPEDEWMAMARDLMDRGETRLAIRAMYLASLSHLAQRGIVSLARHKTDREYEREVALRGEVLSGITTAFKDLTGIFERAWYGMHTISLDTLDFFIARHKEVMTDGSQPTG